jgi:hypothetical protein
MQTSWILKWTKTKTRVHRLRRNLSPPLERVVVVVLLEEEEESQEVEDDVERDLPRTKTTILHYLLLIHEVINVVGA